MLSPVWIAVLILMTAVACFVLWKFWQSQIISINRPKALAGALLLLLFSLAPAIFLFEGFTSGVSRCLRIGCDATYSVDEKPGLFWMNMSILYAIFLALFVAAVYVFWRFLKSGEENR